MNRLPKLTPTEKRLIDGLARNDLLWMPHPENVPQTQAYITEADILYFGGAAGGGKSDLLLGLAATAHRKSIIFRREFSQLRELIDRSTEILAGTGAKYHQTFTRWLKMPGGRTLEFGAVQHEKDREKYKGRPHDLKAFDEIPDFTESQFRFLMAWNRTVDPHQRCRVVCAGNPPTHSEGEWVIRYWAPWVSEYHPNPAKPGELRWFAVLDGKDTELDGPSPVRHKGEIIWPTSRTFIPAFLSDNPYLRDTGYGTVLQNLPEPLRSQLLYGDFTRRKPDPEMQVIPTEWIRAAQWRWQSMSQPEGPITHVGVDPSRGGADTTEIAPRIGNYYLQLLSYPGSAVPDGQTCADLVEDILGPDLEATIHIDIISIGASAYDFLIEKDLDVIPINFTAKTDYTDKSELLEFRNVRAAAHWSLREALDPKDGDDLALPPGDELLADLAAPRCAPTTGGYLLEPKKNIRKRLGRSPGKGDAVVMAHWEPIEGVFFR